MARPPKERALKRSHHITLRLTDIEYELVTNRAKKTGTSRSDYLRKRLLDGNLVLRYDTVADILELQKLTAEFRNIVSSLNQITRYFNMGGIRSKAMQDEIHDCISQIFEMRKEIVKLAGDYQFK